MEEKNNEQKKSNIIDLISKTKPLKLVTICVIALLCIIIVIKVFTPKEREVISISSSLDEIKEIDELASCIFPYNGMAELTNEKGKVITYITYEGEVTLGIEHFSEIIFDVDDKSKIITITLPEIKVLDINVISDKIGVLDEVKNDLPELKRTAEEDLTNAFVIKNADNDYMFECAKDTIKNTLETLINSSINNSEEKYNYEYK